MGDPVRSKVLFAIADRSEGVSIRQVADRIREPRRKVRYHLGLLVEQGLVSVAGEKRRRGVVERYYRADRVPLITKEEFDSVDDSLTRKMSLQVLRAILADASAAASAGMFGARSGHTVIRIPGEVDTQGWEELRLSQTQEMERAKTIVARSEKRLKAKGEEPITAVSALLLFEVPPWPEV